MLVSGKETLDANDFKAQYIQPVETTASQNLSGLTLEEVERQHILQALEQYDNNLTQVAIALGLSRPALYRRLEKHNIVI